MKITDKSLFNLGDLLGKIKNLEQLNLNLHRWGFENPDITDKGTIYLFKKI